MKKHTDSGFTFDIKEDHAAVMEIDGDPQIVEIPEQIDGVPVTELAEYFFPGKAVRSYGFPWESGKLAVTVFITVGIWKSYGFPVILLILEVELLQGATGSEEWKF